MADFALEVMGGTPVVIGGNSIGGGIAAGVAANLRELCRGVVLCKSYPEPEPEPEPEP